MPGPGVGDREGGLPSAPAGRTATVTAGARPGCGCARWRAGWRRPGAAAPRPRRPSTGSSGRSSCHTWSGPAAWASLTACTTSGDEVDGIPGQRPAGVEPGEQQQVLHQRRHPGGFGLDPAERVDDVRRRLGAGAAGQLGVAADGGERRPQLVAGVGDELPDPGLARLPGGERRSRRWLSSRLRAAPTRPASVRGSVSCSGDALGEGDLAPVQRQAGHPPRGGGDPVQRTQGPAHDASRRPARRRSAPRTATAPSTAASRNRVSRTPDSGSPVIEQVAVGGALRLQPEGRRAHRGPACAGCPSTGRPVS